MPAGTPARGATVTSTTETSDLLARGEVTLKGRMPWASNATFLVELALAGATTLAVYKPERGERPLWDFPRGLYKRELAAWHLSEAFGWGLVPALHPGRLRATLFHLAREARAPRAAAADVPLRSRRQQRRPQERPLP